MEGMISKRPFGDAQTLFWSHGASRQGRGRKDLLKLKGAFYGPISELDGDEFPFSSICFSQSLSFRQVKRYRAGSAGLADTGQGPVSTWNSEWLR